MKRTFVFKLYHSKKNRWIHLLIDIAADVYNHCLSLQKRFYRLYKQYIPPYRLQKHLTKLKKISRFSRWNQLGSQAIQEIVERLDNGYKRFFDAIKKKTKRKVYPPRFKSTHKYKSFTLKQAGFKLLGGNRIRIGKKVYKFFNSRDIQGEIKTLTVKRDALGDIYLNFSCEVRKEVVQESMTGKSAGFDFGLLTFCTSSEGEKIESPLFFKEKQKAMKKGCRSLSLKEKGSNQRKKARLSLSRLHRKIYRKRREFHFQLARRLLLKYDALIFEDLDLDSMKKKFGKKISDLGFHSFLQILKGYAERSGKIIHLIDRFKPTSKICSCCDHIIEELPLNIRFWTCTSCGATHDRDINAAINIHRVGASTLGLGNVRPTRLAIAV
jgi:putative transposase